MKKVKKIEDEYAPVKGKPTCATCKHFFFNPGGEATHYYIDDGTAEGSCVHDKKQKVGTSTTSTGCKHWKMNLPSQ